MSYSFFNMAREVILNIKNLFRHMSYNIFNFFLNENGLLATTLTKLYYLTVIIN